MKSTCERQWKPLTNPDVKKQITEQLQYVLPLLKDIQQTKVWFAQEEQEWGSLPLSSGLPGICLLMGELHRLYPEDEWDITGHSYMLEMQRAIQETGIFDLSLWSGLAGIGMAANSLSCGETRYQGFSKSLRTLFLDQYEPYLEHALANLREGVRVEDYDVVMGWTGIGSYLLSQQHHAEIRRLLERVLQYLVSLSEEKEIAGEQVPGWHITSEQILFDEGRKTWPNGIYNTGLSHGIAGPLALLSISSLNGIHVPGQIEAIERIANWLVEWKDKDEYGVYWPFYVSWEEQKAGKYLEKKTLREAWCYGAPGVSRSLWLAGQAAGNPAYRQIAIEAYHATFRRPAETWLIHSPGICHGLAGLLHLTHCMYIDTDIEDFALYRDRVLEMLLARFSPDLRWGYQDIKYSDADDGFIPKDDVGLLNGAIGVYAVLISLIHAVNPEWDQILFIR